jgi:polyhydroxyalkanoic acid synthase PhaR subunit
MAEGSKAQGPMDPMDFWKQWSETSTKMWSNVLDEGKGTYVDPYGLYRPWLKSIEIAQEQMKTSSTGAIDAKEAWNQWYEATTGTWAKAAELGGDPLGLTAQWLEMMEENRAKILAGGTIPADPFAFFKQWYDASNETWSKVVADVIADEKFVENASQFMESYTSYYMATRRANEDYFRNLQLPTRSDLARVAEIIVALEEKVDRLDEAFDDIEDGSSQLATKEAIEELEERVSRVEKKLDALSSVLEKLEIDEKLAKQTDRIDKKLDKVFAAIVKNEAKNTSTVSHTDVGSTRKQPKRNARDQKASGSKVEVEAEQKK